MRNVKNLVITALVGVFVLSATGCSMIEKTPSAIKNTTVAKVGNVKITKGQVDDRMTGYYNQAKAQYGNDFGKTDDQKQQIKTQAKQVLDELVTTQVLLQKGKELKLIPDDAKLTEEANTQIAKIKKDTFGDDQQKFDDAIKNEGFTKDSLLTYFKEQVAIQKVYDDIVKDVKVDDKQINDYYNTNINDFTKKAGATLYHILISTQDNKRSDADALALAKEVKDKIDKGAKFEDMAKKYGEDGTKDSGGSLGYVEYDTQSMDKDFMAGAKVLKEGEVSNPVKSQFGYHIIKATDVHKDAKIQKLEEVKDQIKQQLEVQQKNDALKKKLDEWKKVLNVKTYEDNL